MSAGGGGEMGGGTRWAECSGGQVAGSQLWAGCPTSKTRVLLDVILGAQEFENVRYCYVVSIDSK